MGGHLVINQIAKEVTTVPDKFGNLIRLGRNRFFQYLSGNFHLHIDPFDAVEFGLVKIPTYGRKGRDALNI